MAVIGGAALPASAVEPGETTGDELSVPLDPRPGTPDRMQFFTNAEDGVARPGQEVKVGVEWKNWNIWDAFNSDTQGDSFSLKNDLIKIAASQQASILLDGDPCETAFPPGVKTNEAGKQELVAATEDNPTNYEPLDIGGIVAQIRNASMQVLESLLAGENWLTRFLKSNVKSVCTFTVPEDRADGIRVTGDVRLTNLAVWTNSEIGKAILKVAAPAAPEKPTIEHTGSQLQVAPGGEVRGTGEPGAEVRLKVNGVEYKDPVTTVDEDGFWSLKLPKSLTAGRLYSIMATSKKSAAGKSADSDPVVLQVKEATASVTKPVITSPAGEVKAGDELRVTGTDGNKVSAVDQNGNRIAGPVEVKDGKATLTLPKDLDGATQIKVVAEDGNGNKAESDAKKVGQEQGELYQSLVPSAKPGEGSFLDVTFEPTNGDVTALAGKKLELTAPEGFTFNNQVSFKVFGKEGDGEGIWLGDRVQLSDGGTKATVTLPSAAEIKKTFNASIVAVKFKITTFPKATSGATPGPKTGGQATIDGIGSTKLTGNVTGR
ncbi:MAG: hypothetical protein M3306_28760 [Actinomycetota bacterium]|nr:hypothetical protein [Actinomycetota bacterium]